MNWPFFPCQEKPEKHSISPSNENGLCRADLPMLLLMSITSEHGRSIGLFCHDIVAPRSPYVSSLGLMWNEIFCHKARSMPLQFYHMTLFYQILRDRTKENHPISLFGLSEVVAI